MNIRSASTLATTLLVGGRLAFSVFFAKVLHKSPSTGRILACTAAGLDACWLMWILGASMCRINRSGHRGTCKLLVLLTTYAMSLFSSSMTLAMLIMTSIFEKGLLVAVSKRARFSLWYVAWALWGASIVSQAYFVNHCTIHEKSNEPLNEIRAKERPKSQLPVESTAPMTNHTDSFMMQHDDHSELTVCDNAAGEKYSITDSDDKKVRHISSRTRLLNPNTTPSNQYRSRPNTPIGQTLETIPGSGENSPAAPLEELSKQSSTVQSSHSAHRSSRPASVTPSQHSSSRKSRFITPLKYDNEGIELQDRTPNSDESHIHPLFRSSSPLPPPTPSSGTTVTASAFAGKFISVKSLPRSANSSRPGSPEWTPPTPESPSPIKNQSPITHVLQARSANTSQKKRETQNGSPQRNKTAGKPAHRSMENQENFPPLPDSPSSIYVEM